MIRKSSIVVAAGQNNEIGDGQDLLWRLPKDMKYFKELTWGGSVIMGRITYESIPKKFRPLENRQNIIITRNEGYSLDEDVTIVHSIEEAFKKAENQIFVIGGGQIYKQTLDKVENLYITKVHAKFPAAKTFFPEINLNNWRLVGEEFHAKNDRHAFDFSFQTFEKK